MTKDQGVKRLSESHAINEADFLVRFLPLKIARIQRYTKTTLLWQGSYLFAIIMLNTNSNQKRKA